jgi:hypothetical protein
VLFLANPVIGAAVGAGTLLAQKLLNNPLDQIFSYDYRVTGSWSDPHVERVGSRLVQSSVPGDNTTRYRISLPPNAMRPAAAGAYST